MTPDVLIRTHEWRGWTLHEAVSLASTNDYARDLPPWHSIRARTQTAARGRHGRRWASDQGGLWMSVVLPLDPPDRGWAAFPLAAGLAVVATLRGLGFTCQEIGRRFGITPQAVSATLSRHHRRIDDMKGCPEMSELSVRSVNALSRIGVNSRAEACGRDIFTLLLRERNCGAKSLEEIRRWLERGGAATGDNNYL